MSNNIGVPIINVNRNSDCFTDQNSDMSIGTRVREARKDAGLTQKQLADKVGLKQSTLSELENGDSAGTGYIATMASALSVSPLWLETGKGPKKLSTSLHHSAEMAKRGDSPIHTAEILELISLYGESNTTWRAKIIDLARVGAANSKHEAHAPEKK